MIERASEFRSSAAAPLIAGDNTHLTAGGMLRQAREAHGLHLEAVAAALKIPPKKLEALENDDIDSLPDPVFARALAASICRALRVDPAPVLAKLPGALKDGLAQADRTMSGNIRSHAERHQSRASSWQLSRPLLVVVGLLLVGAAIIYWLPQSMFDGVGATWSRWTSRDASSGDAASAAGESPPVSAVAPGTVIEPIASTGLAAASSTPTASSAVPATAVVAVPPTPVNADMVTFTPRADAWITVTESGGKILLKRTVKSGESVGLSGKPPLAVVVGKAAGVDVQVRGQTFDLVPLTKGGGIARFEVK